MCCMMKRKNINKILSEIEYLINISISRAIINRQDAHGNIQSHKATASKTLDFFLLYFRLVSPPLNHFSFSSNYIILFFLLSSLFCPPINLSNCYKIFGQVVKEVTFLNWRKNHQYFLYLQLNIFHSFFLPFLDINPWKVRPIFFLLYKTLFMTLNFFCT